MQKVYVWLILLLEKRKNYDDDDDGDHYNDRYSDHATAATND